MAMKKNNSSKAAVKAQKMGFFKGVSVEAKKIVWPTKKVLINYAFSTILMSIIVAVFVYFCDQVFHYILRFAL